MPTFLLEIGTEELPADFARLALPQLEAQVRQGLAERRLSHGPVTVTSTPRRLALLVADLAASAADLEEDRKGPPAAQALKDGVPTPAAIGFAKRCGIEASALEVRDTAKGPFVFARVREPGLPAAELLAACIPPWIAGLQGRRFMRWAEGESRFSRPVRWLVALLDGAVIPVTLAGSDPEVSAGRLSRGHRLQGSQDGEGGTAGAGSVSIATASAYAETLAAAGVEVDRQRRAATIRSAVDTAAAALQARPDLPQELFDELTDLVEAPLLIEGSVPEAYLALPAEVLSTVMRAHQRYIPLYRQQAEVDPLALDARASLLPTFLCIANSLPAATDTVRRGNERVLKARLADAEFFVAADRAVSSIDRRDQLARVTFAEGLGSLLNRVERLEWCTDGLVEQLGLGEQDAAHARRAAHLCKHDLVSQMVGEFPELQGVIGGKYLLAEGEARPVALAVLEHYLPRGAGDALPTSNGWGGGGPGRAAGAAVEHLRQGGAAQRLLRPLRPAPGRQWPAADPLAPGLAPRPGGPAAARLRPLGRAAARFPGGPHRPGGGPGRVPAPTACELAGGGGPADGPRPGCGRRWRLRDAGAGRSRRGPPAGRAAGGPARQWSVGGGAGRGDPGGPPGGQG